TFFGADVSKWLTGAVHQAVAHGERIRGRGVAAEAKRPTGKVLAVEEVYSLCGSGRSGEFRSENGGCDEGGKKSEGDCVVFHKGEMVLGLTGGLFLSGEKFKKCPAKEYPWQSPN